MQFNTTRQRVRIGRASSPGPVIFMLAQPVVDVLRALFPVLRELRMIAAIVLKSKSRRRKQ